MKTIRTILTAAALTAALCSCEMKNELLSGGNKTTVETGTLMLSVSSSEPEFMTRADAAPADFPVEIYGQGELSDFVRTFDKAGDVPEDLLLAVGRYRAVAHTPGEIRREMNSPYFMGSQDFEILASIRTRVDVLCRMANSRVRVILDEAFHDKYVKWTITVNDGVNGIITFTESSSYDDLYWYFENETDRLVVDIRATTIDGNSVYAQNIFVKSGSNEGYTDLDNPYFTGGDAINISFSPAEDENGYLEGISISMKVTFENEDETVTVEIKDQGASDEPSAGGGEGGSNPGGSDDPATPGDGPIRVTYYPGRLINYAVGDAYPACRLDFAVDNGIKNLFVYINSSNGDFQTACEDMNISGMDLASEDAADLEAIFALPTVGATAYSFSMGDTIWMMLSAYGAGKHDFTLKAVDSLDNEVSGNLSIIVTE